MLERTQKKAAALIVGWVCLGVPHVARAIDSVPFSGAIAGIVTSGSRVPQMGAAVLLYDHQRRIYGQTLTDERGEFRFLGVPPDLYSMRVTLAAFVPAIRKDILVQPGMRSLLAVNLNALFSSIQLAYPPVEDGALMTDDWKWALRSDSATRPVLRFLDESAVRPPAPPAHSAVFSETRGLLRVSGGEAPASAVASEADLGAAFALATSVYGNNTLEFSGNFGMGSQTGVPVAAFRTGYTRNAGGDGPEASLTVRQLYLPGRLGLAMAGSDPALPLLRSMSASFDDRTAITDALIMQYGFSVDSISFLDRLNYFSPYARLSYTLGEGSEVAFAYTSGNARPDLAGQAPGESGLQRDLNTLGLFPRISLRDGRLKIQRGQEYELTYGRKMGSRNYEASVYSESVANAALTMVAPDGMYAGADVLPDLFAGNAILNAGNYRSAGYTAAVTQNVGEYLSGTLNFGSMGALTASGPELVSNNPDELRAMIRTGRKRAVTARIDATVPGSGTHVIASYQWSNRRWVMPGHVYSTQSSRPTPGLNFFVRQPVPGISSRPCRVEVTADLRNLLAQGYLPIRTAGGQTILLVETPRSVSGGLNIIF
ncbi:MAG: TonB-dependent receptor [Bryobacteraceae bacterium]|jgi:hypothetical protein